MVLASAFVDNVFARKVQYLNKYFPGNTVNVTIYYVTVTMDYYVLEKTKVYVSVVFVPVYPHILEVPVNVEILVILVRPLIQMKFVLDMEFVVVALVNAKRIKMVGTLGNFVNFLQTILKYATNTWIV